jgi:hypothetical protein
MRRRITRVSQAVAQGPKTNEARDTFGSHEGIQIAILFRSGIIALI